MVVVVLAEGVAVVVARAAAVLEVAVRGEAEKAVVALMVGGVLVTVRKAEVVQVGSAVATGVARSAVASGARVVAVHKALSRQQTASFVRHKAQACSQSTKQCKLHRCSQDVGGRRIALPYSRALA